MSDPFVHQVSRCVLQPADVIIPVQRGLLLLPETLGSGVCPQWHDVRLALPGRMSDLHWNRQSYGKASTHEPFKHTRQNYRND